MIDWNYILEGNWENKLLELPKPEEIKKDDLKDLNLDQLRKIIVNTKKLIKSKNTRINKLVDSKNDLDLEVDEIIGKANEQIESITEKNNLLSSNIFTLLNDLTHHTTPIILKNQRINEMRPHLSDEEVETARKNSTLGHVLDPMMLECGTHILPSDSMLPHLSTENRLRTASGINGEIRLAWNNNESTGDTMRVVSDTNAISIAVCDGAGGTGIAGKIYSRILAGIVSEIIPLSQHSPTVLSSRRTTQMLINALRNTSDEDGTGYSRLYKELPFEVASNLKKTISHGKSTVLNVIIHADGNFWYSALGDSQLFIIRTNIKSGNRYLESVYTSINDADDTDLVGLNSSNHLSSKWPFQIESYRPLSPGDIVLSMTDHASDYAKHFTDEFVQTIDRIFQLGNDKNTSLRILNDLINEIDSNLDSDDDISIMMYKMNAEPMKYRQNNILFKSETQSYEHMGQTYYGHMKKYYLSECGEKGLKKIPRDVASNLKYILDEHPSSAPYIPWYEVHQTEDEREYFIVMQHLPDNKYMRLDQAIYQAKSIGDIKEIINQIKTLADLMDKHHIFHSDIAPTNIFLDKTELKMPKIVDLNTLYCHGCFPLDREQGHFGMFGEPTKAYIPSKYIHKLPFNVILFTLEIISHAQDISNFIKDHVEETADEIYLLTPQLIYSVYSDYDGSNFNQNMELIREKFPHTPESSIERFLRQSTRNSIYDLNL